MKIYWRTSKEPVDYNDAIREMDQTVDNIIKNDTYETVWLLEHPSIYTAGSSANKSELLVSDEFPVYHTGRGGKFTYHGPGQRIAYIMLNLKKRFNQDLRKYIFFLEELIISSLKEFGITGERRTDRIGIWVKTKQGEKKIAAIGVRVRKWVSYHGIAVNIAPDLKHFNNIIPCGISEYGVTSMQDLGKNIEMKSFDEVLKQKFNGLICEKLL